MHQRRQQFWASHRQRSEKKADEYSVMTYVLDSKDFVFTGGEFGIESSIIALLGYVIVTLAAICMIKKKAKV